MQAQAGKGSGRGAGAHGPHQEGAKRKGKVSWQGWWEGCRCTWPTPRIRQEEGKGEGRADQACKCNKKIGRELSKGEQYHGGLDWVRAERSRAILGEALLG